MAINRSENMRRIRSGDTRPELALRRALHGLGYRYRIRPKDLPGRPDIVFRARRKAVFVHGCFWHLHDGCPRARMPKSNSAYWGPKLAGNAARDAGHIARLQADGWDTLIVWECELRDLASAVRRVTEFLGPRRFSRPLRFRGPDGQLSPPRAAPPPDAPAAAS